MSDAIISADEALSLLGYEPLEGESEEVIRLEKLQWIGQLVRAGLRFRFPIWGTRPVVLKSDLERWLAYVDEKSAEWDKRCADKAAQRAREANANLWEIYKKREADLPEGRKPFMHEPLTLRDNP